MNEHKLSVEVVEFTPRASNTLRGFCTIAIPELRMRIHDVGVHIKGDARWVSLPAKPQYDRSGSIKRDEKGRAVYLPTVEITDKKTRDAFSQRVIAALLIFAPSAFVAEDEETV